MVIVMNYESLENVKRFIYVKNMAFHTSIPMFILINFWLFHEKFVRIFNYLKLWMKENL